MGYLGLIMLMIMTIGSLILSMQAFCGKDIILDDAYLKASPEEREKMDKKAYRRQSGIIFLFLAAISMCNALRAILHQVWFTYLALALGLIAVIYAIVSHYALRKKR